MSDRDAEESLSDAERELDRVLEELEAEYNGINEGFRIASERLEAVMNWFKETHNCQTNCRLPMHNYGFENCQYNQCSWYKLFEILGFQGSSQEATKG